MSGSDEGLQRAVVGEIRGKRNDSLASSFHAIFNCRIDPYIELEVRVQTSIRRSFGRQGITFSRVNAA